MPTVQLADVIEPEVYTDYQVVDSPEKTAFFQSGIVVRNPTLDEKAETGGSAIDIPYWNDLDADQEPNYSSDDPDRKATPNKIDAGLMMARVSYLNQAYSAANLAGEIAGSDPMQRIASRFDVYWQRQWQRRLLASTRGVMNASLTNNDGDMVHNIAIEDGDNAVANNLYSRTAFTEAAFSMGDQFDRIQAIGVHSRILKRMVDNEDIDYIKDSVSSMMIPTYMGKRVITDDSMPVIAGTTSGLKFISILFGAGAFGYGAGSPKRPMELESQPLEGDGGGMEYIIERKTWMLHPQGYQFTSDKVSKNSPTLADLTDAVNWKRVVDRKLVPMAFLITNG